MKFETLAIAQVEANPDQPRKRFEQKPLDELAASIVEVGLLQPIVVRANGGDTYQIVAGERRWRACRQAAIETIAAMIVEADDETSLVLATAENVNRRDMTPVEEGQAYQSLVDHGRSIEEVAKLFGKGVETVTYRIDLLRLDPVILDMADKGHISKDSAWYLSRLSIAGQLATWRKFTAGDYVDEAELRRGAQAQHKLEQEPSMFKMETETVVEKRREVKALVDRQLDQVRRSHTALDTLLDLSDEDLVVGLGQGLSDLRASLRALEAHARTVRNKVETAEALRIQSTD